MAARSRVLLYDSGRALKGIAARYVRNARRKKRPESDSARPTRLATASQWIGCAAKRAPAVPTSSGDGSASRNMAETAKSTDDTACRRTLTTVEAKRVHAVHGVVPAEGEHCDGAVREVLRVWRRHALAPEVVEEEIDEGRLRCVHVAVVHDRREVVKHKVAHERVDVEARRKHKHTHKRRHIARRPPPKIVQQPRRHCRGQCHALYQHLLAVTPILQQQQLLLLRCQWRRAVFGGILCGDLTQVLCVVVGGSRGAVT